MAGWMKTPLGTEVDIGAGAGHIVLDGFPALRERGTAPPPLGPCLLWPRSPISAAAELLFKYVNKKLGRSKGISIPKNQQGEAVLTDVDKANLLNQFFSSVNVTNNNIVPDFPSTVDENIRLKMYSFSQKL